jgi:hypothetical protein
MGKSWREKSYDSYDYDSFGGGKNRVKTPQKPKREKSVLQRLRHIDPDDQEQDFDDLVKY